VGDASNVESESGDHGRAAVGPAIKASLATNIGSSLQHKKLGMNIANVTQETYAFEARHQGGLQLEFDCNVLAFEGSLLPHKLG
jgi:hypothetical protein